MTLLSKLDYSRPVADLLARAGISQGELARRMGIPRSSVSDAVGRGTSVTVEWLQRAAEAAEAIVPSIDPRLGDTGCVVVSQRALDDFCSQAHLWDEEGRRRLTAELLDARRVSTGPDGERWRLRRKGVIDVTVTVSRDGPLAIVTSIGQLRYRRNYFRG